MANLDATGTTIPVLSFSDFPEDVQLCILSFLTPSEISSFACTSKQSLSVCRNDGKLWFSMCDRRWGSKTQIKKWGSGMISFKHLYKTLHEYENLIGFWRLSSRQSQSRSPNAIPNEAPALIFFEWGSSFITGSRVSPSNTASYNVVKAPFLWMGISPKGEIVNFLEPNFQLKLDSNPIALVQNDLNSSLGNELISVDVNHMGEFHIVIEERASIGNLVTMNGETIGFESGSPPDRITSDLYQYFANRTSPGGERAWRRQRRREKERQGNKKWDAEHFIKIVNYFPTTLRPLQGLWKGIREDANLDFYLVTYDDIGGIACRRIGDSMSSYAPVFWTSNTTFIESPFSSEEEYIYDTREHLLPIGHLLFSVDISVLRILYINSSYDLVLPGLTNVNPHQVEGRIWQYSNGTFGFGFLRDNHIIDLKHIALDGCLLDATESCNT